MNPETLLSLIRGGETTTLQLKENVTNATSIAQEMVAFSNSKGGLLVIGVHDKTGDVTGLSFSEIQRINSLLVTAAQEQVKSPIVIETQPVDIEGKKVIVATIPQGEDKPYMDKDGLIFVKNGSDKRKVTSKDELRRLLQAGGYMYAEETLIPNSTPNNINFDKFKEFYEKKYQETCTKDDLERYLVNLRLSESGKLNLAGALCFGASPQKLFPGFFIAAVWFWGNSLADQDYRSSENLTGTLDQQYRKAFDFVYAKLQKIQGDQSFNSLGIPEVPEVVLQELITNALIHRDYYISDTIRLFVFDNRIEIISPGKLPNNLTEAQIRRGIRKKRNSLLDSFAPDLIPYRGVGSGIVRALQAYPHIDFINDIEGEQFKVVIHRVHNTLGERQHGR